MSYKPKFSVDGIALLDASSGESLLHGKLYFINEVLCPAEKGNILNVDELKRVFKNFHESYASNLVFNLELDIIGIGSVVLCKSNQNDRAVARIIVSQNDLQELFEGRMSFSVI